MILITITQKIDIFYIFILLFSILTKTVALMAGTINQGKLYTIAFVPRFFIIVEL